MMRSFLLHCGLISLMVVSRVFSQSSCSTEKNLIKGKEETSCINLGLSTLPLADIPVSTAILILSFNNFKSLSASSFKAFKQLTELEATNNGMSSFDIDIPLMIEELNLANNTLQKLPQVSQLSGLIILQLSHNQITTIPQDAFKGLKKLTRLELQHNSIAILDDEVFEDLHSLKHLDLSYNELRSLPDHLLSQTGDLEILYLSGNWLTEIPDNFFGELELTYVYLENNSWNCNCALKYFKNWLEEDEDRVYEISKEGPTKNQRSVICRDRTPLIDFSMDYCDRRKGDGDAIPVYTKVPAHTEMITTTVLTQWPPTTVSIIGTLIPATQATTMLPTLLPTTRATTMLPTSMPTTQAITMLRTSTQTTQATTMLPTSTPTTQATTMLQSSTPTKQATTMLPTSTPTTPATTILPTSMPTTKATTMLGASMRTTQATTMLPTSTPTTQATTMLPTSTPTTHATTMLPTSTSSAQETIKATVWPSTTPYPTTWMMTNTVEPITSKVPTSPTDKPNTVLIARRSWAKAFGMKWLEKVILENCCLLHLIIYGLCIFLLLVWMVITTGCLLWIYCCNQDLLRWLPGIRLIRYSMREPMSDEEILLVNNGAIESHFRDQSSSGVTKMLVLESSTRKQEIIYTSAIL
ncbi:platelet glycoprotein Ib alpha chain [Dendropsophus ebraccatus]|uniref:platelet glycoprotein Ib alpha chain n=1 Tax=Dendropsophus ebraccatus TaxID=150705 RepID=UPI00383123FA